MQSEKIQTKDPALTKTRIEESDVNTLDTNSTRIDAHDELEQSTTKNKGTETFKEGVINSEHVNDNDNPARQPDRRDQEGNAFDEGINEHTIVSDTAKSAGINDLNRYANIDNAQTRVLNPDEKDS